MALDLERPLFGPGASVGGTTNTVLPAIVAIQSTQQEQTRITSTALNHGFDKCQPHCELRDLKKTSVRELPEHQHRMTPHEYVAICVRCGCTRIVHFMGKEEPRGKHIDPPVVGSRAWNMSQKLFAAWAKDNKITLFAEHAQDALDWAQLNLSAPKHKIRVLHSGHFVLHGVHATGIRENDFPIEMVYLYILDKLGDQMYRRGEYYITNTWAPFHPDRIAEVDETLEEPRND